MKAALVSTAARARQAERIALGEHLLLKRGEEKTGGRQKQALLADGHEALIAAILSRWRHRARPCLHRARGLRRSSTRRAASVMRVAGRVGISGRGVRITNPALQEHLVVPRRRAASTADGGLRARSSESVQVAVAVRGEVVAEASGPSKKKREAGGGGERWKLRSA
jgi:hypothetical protein